MATNNNQEQSYPIPTGYASGNGLEIKQISKSEYSDGQQNWSAEQFQLALQMGFLTKFTAVKATVTKAAAKAAEPKEYSYTVTVEFKIPWVFKSQLNDWESSQLSFETFSKNFKTIAGEELTKEKMVDSLSFSIKRGKRKSGGSSGSQSQAFTAKDRSELKNLSLIERKMIKEMASPNGLALSKHASFGVQTAIKLGNKLIDFRRKGYHGAVSQAGGCLFFDSSAMYDGYDISHSL